MQGDQLWPGCDHSSELASCVADELSTGRALGADAGSGRICPGVALGARRPSVTGTSKTASRGVLTVTAARHTLVLGVDYRQNRSGMPFRGNHVDASATDEEELRP